MSESAAPTSAPIYLTIPQNVNSQSDKDHIEKLFPTKTMKVCSILQLICAGTAALTQVRSHQKSLILQFIFWNTLISGDFIRCGSTKVWIHIRCWRWNLDRTFLWYCWWSWFDCFTKTLSLLVRITWQIFLQCCWIIFNFNRVIAFMVMSIISSLFAIPLIVISGIGLGTSGYGLSTHESEYLLCNTNIIEIQCFFCHFQI